MSERGEFRLVEVLREARRQGHIERGSRLETKHGPLHICPECSADLMRVGIVDLVYTFELCVCGDPSYDHIVEQLWHRGCFARAALAAPSDPATDTGGEGHG